MIKLGENYRQWNTDFDAGYAVALNKPYIVIHPEEFADALKEVDAKAIVVADSEDQVISILKYVSTQK